MTCHYYAQLNDNNITICVNQAHTQMIKIDNYDTSLLWSRYDHKTKKFIPPKNLEQLISGEITQEQLIYD